MEAGGGVSMDRELPDEVLALVTELAGLLYVTDLDSVPRASLRASLPMGKVRSMGLTQHVKRVQRGSAGTGVNTTTRYFQDALRELDRRGAIVRSETHVRILDRALLGEISGNSP